MRTPLDCLPVGFLVMGNGEWELYAVPILRDSKMSEKINENPEQGAEQQEEQPDAIQLLAERLGMIEAALGVGNSEPSESNLLNRLTTIEQAIAKPQRERNLPSTISWEQAGSLTFMRKHGISLEDIRSGRVQVTRD
jgi:hypothetical protein